MGVHSSASSLFLGILVDSHFISLMNRANPSVVALLTQGGDTYLESVNVHGQRYLGKRLSALETLETIESTERNIQSLIQRLVPDHLPPLMLLAIPYGHRRSL